MIKVIERKRIMKENGFYQGEVNDKKDKAYREAVKKVNTKYLNKKHTTTYYTQTDNVLISLDRLKKAPHFKLEEFKCGCKGKFCEGYPSALSKRLLINAESMRNTLNEPITVTCGLRCKKYNKSLKGSVPNSGHLKGVAVDFDSKTTHTLQGRRKVMTVFKKMNGYKYTYCNEKGSHPNMGNSVHIEVKE